MSNLLREASLEIVKPVKNLRAGLSGGKVCMEAQGILGEPWRDIMEQSAKGWPRTLNRALRYYSYINNPFQDTWRARIQKWTTRQCVFILSGMADGQVQKVYPVIYASAWGNETGYYEIMPEENEIGWIPGKG